MNELQGPIHPALGGTDGSIEFKLSTQRLRPGERLILVTNGITERKVQGGGTFGVEGIRKAIDAADNTTAASTALAIQNAVTECWREALEDDATVVVMAIE